MAESQLISRSALQERGHYYGMCTECRAAYGFNTTLVGYGRICEPYIGRPRCSGPYALLHRVQATTILHVHTSGTRVSQIVRLKRCMR